MNSRSLATLRLGPKNPSRLERLEHIILLNLSAMVLLYELPSQTDH